MESHHILKKGFILFLFAILNSLSSQAAPNFTQVSDLSGIVDEPNFVFSDEDQGHGIAWLDFNNDGLQDMFSINPRTSANSAAGIASRLYQNIGADVNGDYQFLQVILPPAVEALLREAVSTSVTIGDYNGDNYDDIFITNYGANTLLQNVCAATLMPEPCAERSFIDVTAAAKLEVELRESMVATFGDVDGDGDLDLYVGHWAPRKAKNNLYLNNGDGTYSLAPDIVGVYEPNITYTHAVAFTDFDDDGDLDLMVVNDHIFDAWEMLLDGTLNEFDIAGLNVKGRAELYRNDGVNNSDGLPRFTAVAIASGLNLYISAKESEIGLAHQRFEGMGLAIGDYNNDGFLDYYRTAIDGGPLSTNQGNGLFSAIEFGGIVNGIEPGNLMGWGTAFFDADNDGDEDLFRVNNNVGAVNELYINTNGVLSQTNTAVAAGLSGSGYGLALADYDNDGDMDAIVNGIDNIDLFRNDTVSNNAHWLQLQLEGDAPNTNAIGAKIRIAANGADGLVSQMREIHAGSSHSSTHSFRPHFGLGNNTNIASAVIEWPANTARPDGCFKNIKFSSVIDTVPELTQETNVFKQSDCRGKTIAGRVVDFLTKKGIPNVAMLATRSNGSGFKSTTTDANGRFYLTNLADDFYGVWIMVMPTDYKGKAFNLVSVSNANARGFDFELVTDTDGDGLFDRLELNIGTDPRLTDTDGDGLADFDEVNFDGNSAYNPYNPATQTGTDLNALSNDTDNDGITDDQEIALGSNPLADIINAITRLDPAKNAYLNTETISIYGMAGGPGFVSWALEYGAGSNPANWQTLATSSAPTLDRSVISITPKITAIDGAADDRFGSAVAIDGDVMVVGSSADNIDDDNINEGTVRIFTRSGTSWVERATLSQPVGEQSFGKSVALQGNTLVIGANNFAYVYTGSGANWTYQQTLVPGDFPASGTRIGFSFSVAIDDSTIVIGAFGSGANIGAAYVYSKINGNWQQRTILRSDEIVQFENFGEAVDIDNNTIVVGAGSDDGGMGSVYVYTRVGAEWGLLPQKITPNVRVAGGEFGSSLDLDGTTLAVGAFATNNGTVYLFNYNGNSWSEDEVIVPANSSVNISFGGSIALTGRTLLVGATGETVSSILDSGAAYFYEKVGSNWLETRKIVNPSPNSLSGTSSAFFGWDVALSGNDSVVSTLYDGTLGFRAGAVYAMASTTSEALLFSWNLAPLVLSSGEYSLRLKVTDRSGVEHIGANVFTINIQ